MLAVLREVAVSSFVRLGPGKSGGPLGITSHGLGHTILTPYMRSVKFKAGKITRIGGQNDGELIEDGEIPANCKVIIELPTPINPRKYETLITFNPELLKSGMVSCPHVAGPGEGAKIFLAFQAAKKTVVSELEYVFELYMID